MTTSEAKRVMRELARQDHSGETGGRKASAEATVEAWLREGRLVGDVGVIDAINRLGVTAASIEYELAWIQLAAPYPEGVR